MLFSGENLRQTLRQVNFCTAATARRNDCKVISSLKNMCCTLLICRSRVLARVLSTTSRGCARQRPLGTRHSWTGCRNQQLILGFHLTSRTCWLWVPRQSEQFRWVAAFHCSWRAPLCCLQMASPSANNCSTGSHYCIDRRAPSCCARPSTAQKQDRGALPGRTDSLFDFGFNNDAYYF